MNRSFDTHIVRDERSLDGVWNFCMDGFEKTYKMPVPGCWEQHPDFPTHQGKGTYTRVVNVARDSSLRLEFKGVSHTAEVHFDGKPVGHHYNAFTPFAVILKDVKKGEHTLTVEVDKMYDWIQTTDGRDKPMIVSEFGAGEFTDTVTEHT